MADTEKARYFIFLVYPESAPKDWWETLKKSHGSYARSPLHEPDEETKKPHYHVVYRHGGPATLKTATHAIPQDVPANGHVELCLHPRNYQRYLVHLDDPDKQQWDGDPRDFIETCNSFPLDLSRDLSKAETLAIRADIFDLCRDYNLTEYADLLEGLLDTGMFDHFDYACNHTILFSHYLGSRRGRAKSVDESEKTEEEGDSNA